MRRQKSKISISEAISGEIIYPTRQIELLTQPNRKRIKLYQLDLLCRMPL